ncbi:hypothetical protein [Sorangium sp. So ce693]|uniref:hypothetical protein n=1 Tax=Sorangium sp. So ce693 TaxID=3133318 RepID=UPI003F639FC3
MEPRADSGFSPAYMLHRLDGALLLQAGRRFAVLDGDRFVEHAPLAKAVGPGRTASVIFGAWPGAVFAQLMNDAESNANYQQGALYRYRSNRFQLIKKTGPNTYYEGTYYPGDGRLGALIWANLDGVVQTWFDVLEGSPKGTLPIPAKVDGGLARIGIHAMLSLPTGHLFTSGPDNATPEHEIAIERWTPGQPQSVVELPPTPQGTHLEAVSLQGVAKADVYLCGKLVDSSGSAPDSMYLARFDGKSWGRLDTPGIGLDGGRPLCQATADGALWVLIAGVNKPALYRRQASDGAWATAPIPQPGGTDAWSSTMQFVATAPDDLWLALATEAEPARFVLFRTRPVGAVLRFSK